MSCCQNATSSALSGHDSKIQMSVSNQNINQARNSWAQIGVKGLSYTAVKQPTCSAHSQAESDWSCRQRGGGRALCCPPFCKVSCNCCLPIRQLIPWEQDLFPTSLRHSRVHAAEVWAQSRSLLKAGRKPAWTEHLLCARYRARTGAFL